MSQEELNSPPQVPESPRRITEISFTSFASRLEKLEQSETKGDAREKGKIFWLRITRDITKIHEMQNVFKYLRYAQVGPTIKRVKTQTFFNKWKRSMSTHKWVEVASKLRDQIRLNEFKDSANRITYVRSKLTKDNYVKKHQFIPDFTFLSNYVTQNTVQPIKYLIPAEPLPVKDEYEYEYEEEDIKEISQEEISSTEEKVPVSPQQNKTIQQSRFNERAITIDQNDEEEISEEISEEITNEPQVSEEITNETKIPEATEKKKSSKLWIILAVLLVIGAFAAAFIFFGKGKLCKPKSIENTNEVATDEIPTIEPSPTPEVTPENVATEDVTAKDIATENTTVDNEVPEDTSNQAKEL